MDIISRLSGKTNVTDKILIKTLRKEIKRKVKEIKFVIIIVYNRNEVQISL